MPSFRPRLKTGDSSVKLETWHPYFLHRYIFLSVNDISFKVYGRVFQLKRALLVEFIITNKYIFERLNIWQIQ